MAILEHIDKGVIKDAILDVEIVGKRMLNADAIVETIVHHIVQAEKRSGAGLPPHLYDAFKLAGMQDVVVSHVPDRDYLKMVDAQVKNVGSSDDYNASFMMARVYETDQWVVVDAGDLNLAELRNLNKALALCVGKKDASR